jgi:putative methionine-R-sulfoxide reductase with GAF domain/CHASE3 domain sensor protein
MKPLNIFGTPSIRRRISSAFLIMTLFVLVMVAASYFQLRQIRPFSDLIIQDSSDLVNIQTLSSATSSLDADLERYLLIQGAEYKDSVQTDLQGMTDSLALLQKNPIAGTDTVLSDLGTTLTGLQEKIAIILDSESTSSADTNRSIITIYKDIEQAKLLQTELSAKTLTALQTTAQTQGLIANNVLTQSVILGIIVSLIAIVTTVVTDRRLRTISTLTNTAAAISAGDLSQVAPVESNDEIGTLAGAFNNMTSQQRNLINSLEQRVADRTKDLATVAEVGTATATILETDKLLQAVVDLTKERFNLYHSHIYLFDEAGENLVLASGAGEVGRQMVAEGRSIPLDREQSLVARAARERKGVTVNDVTQAPDFLPNPLLPDTRSELAVPMVVGEKVIGVFDIQSDQVGRFTESDVNIQTTLASQVAASIQNVHSFEQSKSQADLESLVNAIGQKIQRATTVEDTLQTAIREVGLALGATRVSANIQANSQSEKLMMEKSNE